MDAGEAGRRSYRWLWITVAAVAIVVAAACITATVLYRHVDEWLRDRAIATMEQNFHAHVTLGSLKFSRAAGTVTGTDLAITPIGLEQYPPVITIQRFAFFLRPLDLLQHVRHIQGARVDGMVITMPPPHPRGDAGTQEKAARARSLPKLEIDSFDATNSLLRILHNDPEKPAKQFVLSHVHVTMPFFGKALRYDADITIPKPLGTVHAVGTFGPWNRDTPRATPVTGNFTLTNADLSTTTKGIAGTLSSTGQFAGPLDRLTVDGTTQTPDFRLAESGHPVALFTTYHAIVDGSTGDTYLQPVQARFRNTSLVCTGSAVNIKGQGHRVVLDVSIQRGRVEDVLWLAVRSKQPLLTGALTVHTSFTLPPDPQRRQTVLQRLWLNGKFHLAGVEFTNPDWDRRIDEISLRTQGRPQEAEQLSDQKGRDDIRIDSDFSGDFTIDHAQLSLHPAYFQVPGIHSTVNGTYALDSGFLDMNGQARLDVPVSHLLTGWKSTLARLADPLFRHDGAPALIPFHVHGPRDNAELSVQIAKGLSVGMRTGKGRKDSAQ